jgi:hypothetical protein
MSSLFSLGGLAAVAALALASPAPPADGVHQVERRRLEAERRELIGQIQDRSLMQVQSRATLARLRIEAGWERCAENEAAAMVRDSNRPAKLLAEAALAACRDWEAALKLALENGAYPYLSEKPSLRDLAHPTRDDMVAVAELTAREAALTRIRIWRNGGLAADVSRTRALDRADGKSTTEPRQRPQSTSRQTPAASAEALSGAQDAAPTTQAGEEIIVVGNPREGCRVRLADRTLTDRELEQKAQYWADNSIPLRVVRPRAADYGCLSKIVFALGKHGVRLFHFVSPREARQTPPK